MLRAVTLYQPYAQLIAWGEKRVETRSWKTTHRGLLAIHAGLDRKYAEEALAAPQILDVFARRAIRPDHLPFGCVVAVARVVDCLPAEGLPEASLNMDNEHAMGDLTPGRFGWILDDVRALPDPVPCCGRQMLWMLPEDVELEVLRQIVGVR